MPFCLTMQSETTPDVCRWRIVTHRSLPVPVRAEDAAEGPSALRARRSVATRLRFSVSERGGAGDWGQSGKVQQERDDANGEQDRCDAPSAVIAVGEHIDDMCAASSGGRAPRNQPQDKKVEGDFQQEE